MILYFSATGNNKYVAQELAERTGDRAVSILDQFHTNGAILNLEEGENLGFVFPTYFYGLPSVVMEILDVLELQEMDSINHYTYFVASYGTSPGATGTFARKALKNSNININAYYSIKMPDTWTPEFDLSDPKKVKALNDAEPAQIEEIAKKIKKKANGDFMKDKHSYPISKICYAVYDNSARKTKHFHVEDNCMGCGLCVKKCPVNAIELVNSKPVWTMDKCVMCAGCLHRCPVFAIQYGNKTQGHGQYRHPGVTV